MRTQHVNSSCSTAAKKMGSSKPRRRAIVINISQPAMNQEIAAIQTKTTSKSLINSRRKARIEKSCASVLYRVSIWRRMEIWSSRLLHYRLAASVLFRNPVNNRRWLVRKRPVKPSAWMVSSVAGRSGEILHVTRRHKAIWAIA